MACQTSQQCPQKYLHWPICIDVELVEFGERLSQLADHYRWYNADTSLGAFLQ